LTIEEAQLGLSYWLIYMVAFNPMRVFGGASGAHEAVCLALGAEIAIGSVKQALLYSLEALGRI
jgi:hypothetical protein